jgi:7-keto-8-aminopelargonate synthetase-like enzyme
MPGASIQQQAANRVVIDGARLVAFAGCNYLGLAHDPRVLEAARDATEQYGLSTSASRETSGNTPVHEALERALIEFIGGGTPLDGVLVPDGYTANLAAAQALAATHPLAVVDERAHASLPDAASCAGMRIARYAHSDPASLAGVLAHAGGPAVVMTDGVFTADGGVAAVEDLLSALRAGDRLLIDDCHALGVLGDGGQGVCAHLGVPVSRVVLTTTLAKGLGGGGGIVISDRGLIGRVRTASHAYICTTPVSPIVAAGTLRALQVLIAEPDRVARLRTNARLLGEAMHTGNARETPICALPVRGLKTGERIAAALRDAGLFVPLMAYPGGPTPWYLRASVTSEHTAGDLALLARCMEGLGCRATA